MEYKKYIFLCEIQFLINFNKCLHICIYLLKKFINMTWFEKHLLNFIILSKK